MYRTHRCLWKHSEQLRQRWWSDNNMKDYSLSGWLITITANHSNYLVIDRANTQSVTVRKVVKLQLNYCNALVIKWIYNIVLFGGRTRDVHSSSLLIDVYALFSDVSLRRQASMTQAEKFPDPFCSRAMLICSIIWLGKRMLRVVVLRVLFFIDMRLPRIQCRWFVLSEVVFTLVSADQLIRYLRHNWLFDVVWWPPRTLWYVDDNHYHFTGPFRWKKRYQKNIVVSSNT